MSHQWAIQRLSSYSENCLHQRKPPYRSSASPWLEGSLPQTGDKHMRQGYIGVENRSSRTVVAVNSPHSCNNKRPPLVENNLNDPNSTTSWFKYLKRQCCRYHACNKLFWSKCFPICNFKSRIGAFGCATWTNRAALSFSQAGMLVSSRKKFMSVATNSLHTAVCPVYICWPPVSIQIWAVLMPWRYVATAAAKASISFRISSCCRRPTIHSCGMPRTPCAAPLNAPSTAPRCTHSPPTLACASIKSFSGDGWYVGGGIAFVELIVLLTVDLFGQTFGKFGRSPCIRRVPCNITKSHTNVVPNLAAHCHVSLKESEYR